MVRVLSGFASFLQRNLLTVVFFGLLFIMLFLGDGKASFVDIMGAAVTMTVFALAKRYHKATSPLPSSLLVPWVLLLGYLAISTVLSVDVGYSVRAYIRYLEAFVLYSLFYQCAVSSDRTHALALVVFGGITTLLSILFSEMFFLRPPLPGMNLFWSGAGHSHAADIVLFVLPSLLAVSRGSFGPFYVAVTAAIALMVYFHARTALVLSLLGVAAFLAHMRQAPFRRAGVLYFIVIGALGLTVTVILPEVGGDTYIPLVRTELSKSPLLKDARSEYWRQAVTAIRERPLFGSGPGTFSLLAKAHQTRPDISSWFAHNYLLETAAETGVVGLALYAYVLVSSVLRPAVRLLKKRGGDAFRLALVYGPLLTLLYGLMDFPMSYLVVWMMFWSSAGRMAAHVE